MLLACGLLKNKKGYMQGPGPGLSRMMTPVGGALFALPPCRRYPKR